MNPPAGDPARPGEDVVPEGLAIEDVAIEDVAIEDRLALRELAEAYTRLVDRRDGAGLARLFTADGVMVSPDPADLGRDIERVGRDQVASSLDGMGGLLMTRHLVLGQELAAPDADRIDGTVTGEAHHLSERGDAVTDFAWSLRYLDRYVRVDGRWLIARRHLVLDWIEHRPVRFFNRPGASPAPG